MSLTAEQAPTAPAAKSAAVVSVKVNDCSGTKNEAGDAGADDAFPAGSVDRTR